MARRLWQTRNLRVLVDMDEVLCHFERRFLELYRQKFPHSAYIELENRNTFWVENQYAALDEELREKVRSILRSEHFFSGMEPIEGAIDAVKEISSMDGVDVFICTSWIGTSPIGLLEKVQWVERHMGKHWGKRIIFTNDKTMINGDILIDDKPDIKGVVRPAPWLHVLFTSVHNKHLQTADSQVRLNDWSDQSKWRSIIEDAKKKL